MSPEVIGFLGFAFMIIVILLGYLFEEFVRLMETYHA